MAAASVFKALKNAIFCPIDRKIFCFLAESDILVGSSSIRLAPSGPMKPSDVDPALAAAFKEIARLRAEVAALRTTCRTHASILDNAPLLISTKDLQGKILMANKYFNVLEGYDEAKFVGKNLFEVFPEAIAAQLWANDQRAAAKLCPVHEEETVYHRDKTTHTYATVKFPLFDEHGVLSGTCAVSTDITAARLAQLDSVTDELTRLKNRRSLNLLFMEEQRSAHRGGRSLTLLLADVDCFKGYNDRYGHPQGDVVLMAVARAISATLNRSHDLAFRIGGDEFACLFSTTEEQESVELAERIRARFQAHDLDHPANQPHGKATLSAGLTFLHPGQEVSLIEAYERADQALYRAKHRGRNTVSR
jgi:diguanylate cyclase (GGDEF)-like protein/PAS domain S-box-containing protein